MDTLVLDTAFNPYEIVRWERAITLWYDNKVEILHSYPDRFIHAVNFTMPVPCVVRWVRGNFKKKKRIAFSKDNVYLRDRALCQYCGIFVPREDVTYDHVIPRKLKGKSSWTNIVLACEGCNQRKGGRTPEQAGMRLLKTPVQPNRVLIDKFRINMVLHRSIPDIWRTWIPSSIMSVSE